MRSEDTNFESMMEGNDSMFATNLQEPLVTPLTNPEATAEKSGQSARVKPSSNFYKNIIRMQHNFDNNLQINKIFESVIDM